MAQTRTDPESVVPGSLVRRSGLVCLVAGILGAASGVFLSVYPGQVPDDRYSYPLTAAGFVAIQLWFGVHHLGLLAGIAAQGPADVLGSGKAGRWGVRLGVAGMALLALAEVLAVTARHEVVGEGTALLDTLYGVSTTVIGVGLVVAGLAVRRAGRWTGWRGNVVLVAGIWVFVPMIPALMGPFLAARLAITGWMLVFAGLGYALWRSEEVGQ